MKAITLSSVKDGGSFKREKKMRAVWMKKIKKDGDRFICTSTSSEKSYSIPAGQIVYVKD